MVKAASSTAKMVVLRIIAVTNDDVDADLASLIDLPIVSKYELA
jgi:hypothetical protein